MEACLAVDLGPGWMDTQDFVDHSIKEGQPIRKFIPGRVAVRELAQEFSSQARLVFRVLSQFDQSPLHDVRC